VQNNKRVELIKYEKAARLICFPKGKEIIKCKIGSRKIYFANELDSEKSRKE
jgi:hypothetical protein